VEEPEVVRTARHHHERYDGQGYPDRLAGEDIPLGARILALADAYDALTSPRPYRRAFSIRESLAHITEAAGSQFDPGLVRTFLHTPDAPWSAYAGSA
jgi:HD-GYP domain-containing protein (c-di-GMP phosphodiesterase class II)